jgi:hypothetical protein
MKKKFLAVVAALAIMSLGTTALAAESPVAGSTVVEEDASQAADVGSVTKPIQTTAQMATATTAKTSGGVTITSVAVQDTTVTEAVKAAKNAISNLSDLATVLDNSALKAAASDSSKVVNATVATVVNLEPSSSIAKGSVITITNKAIKGDATYAVMHYVNNGWEYIKATNVKDNSLQFVVDSLSPIAIVEVSVETKSDYIADESSNSSNNKTVTSSSTSKKSTSSESVSKKSASKSSKSTSAGTSPRTGETMPIALIGLIVCVAGAFACSKKLRQTK